MICFVFVSPFPSEAFSLNYPNLIGLCLEMSVVLVAGLCLSIAALLIRVGISMIRKLKEIRRCALLFRNLLKLLRGFF